MQGKTVYLVEVGVLMMDKTNPDYDAYACAYDKKYGYYDEGQYYKEDKEAAIKEVQDYVKDGVENTYGIVSETIISDYVLEKEESVEDICVEGEEYNVEDIIFSTAKINERIVENFIKKP